MRRTTLVSADDRAARDGAPAAGSLKIFFSYAPCSGATAAMLDEAQGLTSSGRDVFVAELSLGGGIKGAPFDLDKALKRRPDVVVLENLALSNGADARNRMRYQDVEELLRAGIDVYATLRVGDLQNEQDHVRALHLPEVAEPVPDYLLYGAQQLEFVDIDPAELVERARETGRDVPDVRTLKSLRLMALRCISEYAANSEGGADADAPAAAGALHDRVVALVEPGESPAPVLFEARRLAALSSAPLVVLCVRRELRPGSRRLAWEDGLYGRLAEQVEAMGFELATLHGTNEAAVVRGYLEGQGVSDVVLARRRVNLLRRLSLPVLPSFEERAVFGVEGVRLHFTEAAEPSVRSVALRRGAFSALEFRKRDFVVAALVVAASYFVARLLVGAGFGDATSYLVFVLGAAAVAGLTHNYLPSAAAVAALCLLQDYSFIRPYNTFEVDHRASLMAFWTMAFVMAAVSFVSVRLGREAERSRRREQRTQALLDLSRNLMRPRNAMGLVDVSLDAVERLFGRSAALYVRDPFDRRPDAERSKAAAVRAVEGDAGQGDFDRLTEHAVVHWVFSNATAAGNGTDTHEESYIFYLPLAARGNVVGVLGVSAKREPLEAAERLFLELVAGQVMLALERQELAARHVADVDRMRVAEVRETFYASVLASADVASDLVHDLMDVQLALGSDAVVYREALEEAVSDESARLRLMIDRLIPVLALQPEGPDCDVRAEVTRAVDEAREGLMGRVIDLEPGDPVPAVVADAQLVRLAVRFILDAAASYVPRGGMIRVSVRDHPDNVLVVVADDRPSELGSSHAAAFETSVREGGETVLVYDELRARGLYTALLDRACVTGDSDAYVASLCHALRLPEGVARGEGSVDALNRRRLMRYDRLEYGLYMAAQIVRAHGGSIRQRYRLGGGAVVSFTLPKE